MVFTIKQSGEITHLVKGKKEIIPTYSFIDIHGRCICMVHGNKGRDFMKKYLT